jgi:putative transposase
MVSFLCKISGVSRSGYYNYFSSVSQGRRKKREKEDLILKGNILKAFHFKRRKKGARQIKMTLEGQFQITYNLKQIRRIMRKYKIICPIRRANPYQKMLKASQEHSVLPNLLNREFKQEVPGKVLLTDITYFYYGNGQKAFLSTIKDSSTNEILAYNVSSRMTLDLVTDTLDDGNVSREFPEIKWNGIVETKRSKEVKNKRPFINDLILHLLVLRQVHTISLIYDNY